MKLYISPTSPFARKAHVTLIEKKLENRIEVLQQNPFEDTPELLIANPLGRVPVLLKDNNSTIVDSPVICAYLDDLGGVISLLPKGEAKWSSLTDMAMADGVTGAAFAIVMERKRPVLQRSQYWLDRWSGSIARTLNVVDAKVERFAGPISLAQIALSCALGYLDFRLPDLSWRDDRPSLAVWYGRMSQRPSLLRTQPTEIQT